MESSSPRIGAQFDKWFVDGIIARLTALWIAARVILRAFQPGVVHVYAAVMVMGIAVFGWFRVAPAGERHGARAVRR